MLGEERGNRYCVAFQLINCALYMNIFSLPHNNNNNAIKEMILNEKGMDGVELQYLKEEGKPLK